MRRAPTVAVVSCAAVLAAALAGWWWWTAPPRADRGALESALAAVPESATGAVAVPIARGWLFRHPQVAVVGALAAPSAWRQAEPMVPALRALAEAADGPVVAWWNPDGLAMAARVEPSYVEGLRTVAALRGVVWRQRQDQVGSVVVMASADTLGDIRPWRRSAVTGERLAALAHLPGGTWQARAGRSWFEAWRGDSPPLESGSGPSRIATAEIGDLLRPAGISTGSAPMAAVAVFSARDGWGVEIADAGVRRWLARLGAPVVGAEPQRWDGILGTMWIDPDDDAVASSAAMLTAVATAAAGPADSGSVAGADAAWVLGRLRSLLRRLPVATVHDRDLARAEGLVAPLERLRWTVSDAGSRLRVEW